MSSTTHTILGSLNDTFSAVAAAMQALRNSWLGLQVNQLSDMISMPSTEEALILQYCRLLGDSFRRHASCIRVRTAQLLDAACTRQYLGPISAPSRVTALLVSVR
jgi:hypothetical protein